MQLYRACPNHEYVNSAFYTNSPSVLLLELLVFFFRKLKKFILHIKPVLHGVFATMCNFLLVPVYELKCAQTFLLFCFFSQTC